MSVAWPFNLSLLTTSLDVVAEVATIAIMDGADAEVRITNDPAAEPGTGKVLLEQRSR